ncbi:hypothetical protein CLAIMM_15213 [Cladophialophora immunda]|nr:hypothetical protein CLAIMM_15213 [Cladophialophora immunda]
MMDDHLPLDAQISVHLEILQQSLQLYLRHILNSASRIPHLGHRTEENNTNVTRNGVHGRTPPACPWIGVPEPTLSAEPPGTLSRAEAQLDFHVETTNQPLTPSYEDRYANQPLWLANLSVEWTLNSLRWSKATILEVSNRACNMLYIGNLSLGHFPEEGDLCTHCYCMVVQ